MGEILAGDMGGHPERLIEDFQQDAVPVGAVKFGFLFHVRSPFRFLDMPSRSRAEKSSGHRMGTGNTGAHALHGRMERAAC